MLGLLAYLTCDSQVSMRDCLGETKWTRKEHDKAMTSDSSPTHTLMYMCACAPSHTRTHIYIHVLLHVCTHMKEFVIYKTAKRFAKLKMP